MNCGLELGLSVAAVHPVYLVVYSKLPFVENQQIQQAGTPDHCSNNLILLSQTSLYKHSYAVCLLQVASYRSLYNPCNTEKAELINFQICLRLHSHCTKISFHNYMEVNSVSIARIMQTPVAAICLLTQ